MKVAIVGITGYSGLELVKILQHHPKVDIGSIHATKEVGQKLSDIYPHLTGICDLTIDIFDSQIIMNQTDLVIFATPSGVASKLSKDFLEANFPVIDISGDHRLDVETYAEWYHKEPAQQEVLDKFIYSLAEFADIKGEKFISNPGCYATATEIALLPLVKAKVIAKDSIIVDAKSGLTGAGKALSEASHFVNVHDNYVTYKLNHHQHIPEIEKQLRVFDSDLKPIQFSTSLLPVNRGLIATCYVKLKKDMTDQEIWEIFQNCYGHKPFVRLQKNLPELHNVIGSNFTDIGFAYNQKTQILTIIAVIDNLIKGAAGQAIQNLNLMMGWEETTGFLMTPTYL